MPTTEGALDFRYDLTMAMDGYPGQEHALPIAPLYKDVVQLFAQTRHHVHADADRGVRRPVGRELLVHARERRTTTRSCGASCRTRSSRRRRGAACAALGGGGNSGGWFMEEEYLFPNGAKIAERHREGRRPRRRRQPRPAPGTRLPLGAVDGAIGGMSPMDVLRCATIFGAEAIGLQKDLGSLEAGKLADLVVLDTNPLENIRNSNTVRYVMKNGRLYDGNTLDEIWPRQRKMESVLGVPQAPVVKAGIPRP